MGTITLLTDFGLSDTFVAAMKGVIQTIAPGTTVVDLTHDIRPHDVTHGSYLWRTAVGYFPLSTVHVGVVDPGVGTQRRAIAVQRGSRFFVCPDNGLITDVLGESEPDAVVEIVPGRFTRPTISRTFHGRDIFAPAAAHLSAGTPLTDLGPRVTDVARLRRTQGGTIRHIDHFGNAWTDIDAAQAETAGTDALIVGARALPVVQTYADVAPGQALAIAGSHGMLEIAVNCGRAADVLGLTMGLPVTVRTKRQ